MNNEGQYTNAIALPGDIWSFPESYSHTLQGVHPVDGCKMALFFDAPQSPIYNDLSISQMMNAFPLEVLSENFGTPPSIIQSFRDTTTKAGGIVLVSQGPFPIPPMPQSDDNLPNWPIFNVENGVCSDAGQGGYMYQVRQEQFAAATTMSGGFLHLNRTSMREIHWHPNADEMQYVLKGAVNVTVYGLGDVSASYTIEVHRVYLRLV
jgi:oxalate decarboxylase